MSSEPVNAASQQEHRWAVILAGGSGTRLQELTRRITGDSRPKQFCHFFGSQSLLEHTRERIAPLFQEDRTLFVLVRAHQSYFDEELAEVKPSRMIIQPANCGTAAAMALCLRTILQYDEDALVAFFPSDHHYLNCSAFRDCIDCALRLVPEYPQNVLIVGAEAQYPETEYGWIEKGRTLVDQPVHPLLRLSRFSEKPALGRAERLQRQGALWNTFVTIGLAGAFLELLDAAVPRLARSFVKAHQSVELEQLYNNLGSVDFSRAVLAKMPGRLVVLQEGASGWTDLGTPRRLAEVLARHGIRPHWFSHEEAVGSFGTRTTVVD